MAAYLGDILAAQVLDFKFNTFGGDNAPITFVGSPVVSVYKSNSTTESTTGVTLTVDFDGRTGSHNVNIDTSADGTFYAAGNDFQVEVTAGTADGTSQVGVVLANFSIENRTQKADVRKLLGTAWLTPAVAGTPDVNTKLFGGTAQTGRDIGASVLLSPGTGTGQISLTSGAVMFGNTSIATVTTVTNQLTAAQIATGVWQDTTAGDFTVSSSIGKSLYTSGVVPGAAGGFLIAGSNAATTLASLTISGAMSIGTTLTVTGATSLAALSTSGTVTFNAFVISNAFTVSGTVTGLSTLTAAQVNTEADAALADVGLTTTITGRIDVATSTRMATYVQPTGFLAGDFTRLDAAVSTRMATFTLPTNFSSLGINASGHVSRVTLVDTTTNLTNGVSLSLSSQNLTDIASAAWDPTHAPIRTLTDGSIRVASPVQVGRQTIVRGASYYNADSNAITITKGDEFTWPSDLFSASAPAWVVKLYAEPTAETLAITPLAASLSGITGTVVSATVARFDVTLAQTATLALGRGNGAYRYTVVATRATTPAKEALLENGAVDVLDDIATA